MTARAQRCARAVIEYDGTAFAGSQVQPNARTVQGELEKALNRLIGEETRVHLAGRTDAGVHATGQVVAFCYARQPRGGDGLPELRRRLNAALPPDLTVRSLRVTGPGFDPRREARWRVYRYRILMNGARHPLDRHRTLEIDEPLDAAAMRAAAARMLGERDFAAVGADARGRTVRHLAELRVVRRGDLLEIRVTANAFLRRMVRSIVALLMEVGRGRLAPEAVDGVLEAARVRSTGAQRHHEGSPWSGSSIHQPRNRRTNEPRGPPGPCAPTKASRRPHNVKTYAVKASEIERSWWVVDATGQTLGRLATRVATLLEGKHKPMYSPHLDTGDHVVVLNAGKIKVTGDKLRQKSYFRHSNYPGGLREESLGTLLERKPELVIERAVKGMLPQNRLGRAMFKKLKVYSGADHPHQAQQPTAVEL